MIWHYIFFIGFLSFVIFFGAVIQSAQAEDHLYPPSEIKLLFNVADEMSLGHARVWVLIRGNGYQMKYPGSKLVVNGYELSEKSLSSRGVQYGGEIPQAEKYDFVFTLVDGQIVARSSLLAQSSDVEIPHVVSRGQGFTLNCRVSPTEQKNQRYVVFIEPQEKATGTRFVQVVPQKKNQHLIGSSEKLRKLPIGKADFSLQIHVGSKIQDIVTSSYTMIYRTSVVITE